MATKIKPQATRAKTGHEAKAAAAKSDLSTSDDTLVSKVDVGRRVALTRLALAETEGTPEGQVEFAVSLGIPRSAWNQFEKGQNLIPVPRAALLYDRFGVSLNWIYVGAVGDLTVRFAEAIKRAEAKLDEQAAGKAKRQTKRAK